MSLWNKGELLKLLNEGQTIQNCLKSMNKQRTISEISKRFAEQMEKGNINGAIKLLTQHAELY